MGTRIQKLSERRKNNSGRPPAPLPVSGLRHPGGLTDSMFAALHWIKGHGGSGVRCKPNRMLAGGEYAPCMFETFERLKSAGLMSLDGFRWVLTDKGRDYIAKNPQ